MDFKSPGYVAISLYWFESVGGGESQSTWEDKNFALLIIFKA